MKNIYLYSTILATTSLVACSPSDTPYIDMCQKVTGNLVDSVSEWSESSKSESNNSLFVTVAYATSGGDNGTATCKYEEGDNGNYVTSPRSVSLNGRDVSQKSVMVATLKSTKATFKESAEETKAQATELAGEASEKAAELAVKAEEMAGDARVKATELAGKAQEKASELAGQASDIADIAKEKAREAALDASKAVQDKLEK
jgi:hypothetical protein